MRFREYLTPPAPQRRHRYAWALGDGRQPEPAVLNQEARRAAFAALDDAASRGDGRLTVAGDLSHDRGLDFRVLSSAAISDYMEYQCDLREKRFRNIRLLLWLTFGIMPRSPGGSSRESCLIDIRNGYRMPVPDPGKSFRTTRDMRAAQASFLSRFRKTVRSPG